jgi:phytol kinase
LLHNNLLAAIFTFAIALAWLRINDFIAHRGWVSSSFSRKIIHVGTGPIFVLSWLLFDDASISRWLAALVPVAITSQFVLVGTGIIKDPAAVLAMSRSGDRREILKGPLYYGLVFVVLTLVYWKDSPIGIVALMIMCGGDGLADVAGRRWGARKLPWNTRKSWIGSLGMLLGGWILAAVIFSIFTFSGTFSGPVWKSLPALIVIVIACTIIETLPVNEIDNLTVTATAILFGHLLFISVP